MSNDEVPTVRELLLARREQGYRGGEDDDGYKVGLAVEGGGMRGVISGAMMIAVRDLGLKDLFDGFYGTSSGSINVAYFLNGDSWRALATYYDHLVGSDFVSFSRMLRGQRPVRIDTVMDLMDGDVAIDYERVLKESQRVRFGIGVSNVETGEPEYIYDFADADDLRRGLRVGAWLPVLAGPPQPYRNHHYLDGGVFVPAPYYVALDDGCTHVLQLVTRTEGPPPDKPGVAERFAAWRLDKRSHGTGKTFLSLHAEHLQTLKKVGFTDVVFRDARLHRLACEAGSHSVDRLTMDRSVLLEGARAAYDRVLSTFGEEEKTYFKVGPQ